MVRADLTRDYYGDLEISPNADVNDIKKQFKKLALLYHPDRNPGRESEVTARFQKIQSAHEVLTDAHERAKYDANRPRPSNTYRTGGNPRGNPWSNVASQYPPPPKPPTARRPPPPSAGAQRYKNFETPRQSANKTAQEGAEARRSTYEAWERMRERVPPHGSGSAFSGAGPIPKGTPRPTRDETGRSKNPSGTKSRPVSGEFQSSPHRRATSQTSSNRKGFMPNTPGGDEPAAPRGAYFTQRDRSAQVPPPRDAGASTYERPPVDPLGQFRERVDVAFEPRQSTPYATHGGEKFNPFESANMSRSKSTRVPSNRYSSNDMPRVGSDSKLNSPPRPHSQETPAGAFKPAFVAPDSDDSSSDDAPKLRTKTPRRAPAFASASQTFANAGNTRSTPPKTGQFSTTSMFSQPMADGTNESQKPHEPSAATDKSNTKSDNGPSIFSFKLDPDTFKRTAPSSFRPHSTESINTKFTPEDWHATFEASHFIPEQKTANLAHRPRAQSGSRSRGRSPTKVRPTDSNFTQAQAEPEPPVFPRGAKFSQAEWAGTFKPQTFMQPPVTPIVKPTMAQRPSRRRVPRPTMGTAAVVDDGDTSDEPIFQGRKQSATAAPPATAAPSSPDAMDVDMPPAASASTPAPNASEGMGAKVNSEAPKRAAATSQPPTDTESLKVNFEDLKIQDLISNMDLPTPPVAPQIPAALLPPTKETYSAYEEKFKTYMREWDLFSTRMMLHLVARKNQNDTLGATRWMNGEGIKFYRKGLQEDIAVLQWWDGACQQHGENMKQHQVLMEGMTETEERPRKKTTH
ncbi:hypothetical protein M430DRAFT_208043 [Amorphotheca resinae ATCC 22711]|uniref:J domain-containing protein n=1 Tax=Amorphotheca resinae ATCC 22711 TaxID=857342 RepID=A0A2T3BC44_AMORE|nr:hypothetical protein M430DRAFT_208043 [Amorphotheca resinae ATCC 22711]PSS25891.1 hypothetical protein M430DRAFT_208043 [Amorphotheca resinae ATCC 22711]